MWFNNSVIIVRTPKCCAVPYTIFMSISMTVYYVENPVSGEVAVTNNRRASITLPRSLFTSISGITQVGVFFAEYRRSTVFPVREKNMIGAVAGRTTEVGSTIIAATVGRGRIFRNLETPVEVNLRISSQIGRVSSIFVLFLHSFI